MVVCVCVLWIGKGRFTLRDQLFVNLHIGGDRDLNAFVRVLNHEIKGSKGISLSRVSSANVITFPGISSREN